LPGPDRRWLDSPAREGAEDYGAYPPAINGMTYTASPSSSFV